MTSDSTPLRVAVVGAGLGGLAVSIALRRQGHVVEIFEASDTNIEVGFGITVPPNGGKVLQNLGYERGNILPKEWKQGISMRQGINHPDLFDMQGYPSVFGGYWDACSRRALHFELKRLALDEEHEYPPCTIHLSSSAVSCNPEEGTITLKDGQSLQFDLVIGADGIRSRIRQAINPTLPGPSITGICAFRFTLEKRPLESLPGTEWIMHEGLAGPRTLLLGDHYRHVFMYAINDPERGEILNVAVTCEDKRDQSTSKWRVDVPRDEMLAMFSDLDEKWQQLLGLAPPTVTLWQLRTLEPVQTWSRGKACILGDAAHAMFQALGQGAAQAFEDALVLGTLLPSGTPKSEIPGILKRYETIRKPRVHSIQKLSTEQIKDSQYVKSLGLQLPVMGYDVTAEMGRYGPFSGLQESGEGEVSCAAPLVNGPN